MAMKRDRQTNWSMDEESTLVDFCVNNYSFLYGGLGPTVTKQGRHTKWEELREEISAVGPGRTIDQLKKKWTDLKSAAKKNEIKRRHFAAGTGGGPAPQEPTDVEMKILSVIPEEMVTGVAGGVDVFEDSCKPHAVKKYRPSEPSGSTFTANSSTHHDISISEEEVNGKEDSNTESRPTPPKRNDIAHQMLEEQKKQNEFLAMINFNLAELVSLKRTEVQILSEKHLNKTFF
ncbi:hypothetical protein MAR_013928 [Mya arenaria]|uniref:Myb-like domain-containing protein n=2 Tax=Mya arenaria TaxID=6604 RepID=A0ABY7G4C0_MYAAR|nr:hypothetical protein MAR_013928 [Mya arenaria]